MRTGRGPRLSTGLAAIGAVLLVVGLIGLSHQLRGSATSDPRSVDTTAAVQPTSAGAARTVAEPVRAPTEPGAPRRVLIPQLGVAARVVSVRATNDTLVPPTDPARLGWWADGAAPGAARGSALVAGHTVRTGGGALEDLEQLTRGALVVVRTDRTRIRYAVAQVRIYDKGRLARNAGRIFSQEVPGRLVLITCEDWDGSRYLSNVVVVARPVAA